jgi:hypothetical protein
MPAPIFPGKGYESWHDLDGPTGLDTAGVRPIRDDIERRVRQLIEELTSHPTLSSVCSADNAPRQLPVCKPPSDLGLDK